MDAVWSTTELNGTSLVYWLPTSTWVGEKPVLWMGGTVNVSSWGLIDHCTGGHWSPRPRKNLPPDFRHPDLLYSWRCFCSGNAVTMAQCELCLIVLAGNVLFHLLTHIFVRNVETVLSLYLYCSEMCCVRSSVLLLLRDWFYFVWQLQAGLVYR